MIGKKAAARGNGYENAGTNGGDAAIHTTVHLKNYFLSSASETVLHKTVRLKPRFTNNASRLSCTVSCESEFMPN